MKATDLTVEINATLTVSDATALRCLRILEIWQDDNPDKFIICEKIGGKNLFSIKRRNCERAGD